MRVMTRSWPAGLGERFSLHLSPTQMYKTVRMRVVILCGGMGTRIRDASENLPKPLLPIGGGRSSGTS